MAQTVTAKYIGEGHEVYSIQNLILPNSYELLLQELNIPNTWANGAQYFLGDSDFINNYTLPENEVGVGLLSKAIKDDEHLLNLIFDIIGYGKKKIYGYGSQRMVDRLNITDVNVPTHLDNIINKGEMNPSPSDYEYNTKKRSYGGYTPYHPSKKMDKKKKMPSTEIINHKITQFITPSWINSQHGKDNSDNSDGELDFIYNPMGNKSSKHWAFAKICQPIISEIQAFNNHYNLRKMCELTAQRELPGEENSESTLLVRRQHIYDSINLRQDYASEKDKLNAKELLINSPLMNIGFFENMKTMPIDFRAWGRWINGGIGNLNQLNIPQLSLPHNKPFILINYSTNLWQPWEGTAEIDIYLIFNKISFKDYNINVNKAIPKGAWYKQHNFNQGRMGRVNIKNKNKYKIYLDNNIYLGYHIRITDDEINTNNFFGPIKVPIHPNTCRDVMSEWDEDNEFPTEEIFYKYKIIELNDMYKKMVNWPRTKPVN
jgi:hypothetical protein